MTWKSMTFWDEEWVFRDETHYSTNPISTLPPLPFSTTLLVLQSCFYQNIWFGQALV